VSATLAAPPQGTVERWAWDLVTGTSLAAKLDPPDPRGSAQWECAQPERRVSAPGRPAELRVVERAPKRPGAGALATPRGRARLAHLCLHHELQAAELFAWALLAFPRTPRAFRRGLLALALEEARHARLYAVHVARLGSAVGDFPVRDWLWQRVGTCATPQAFVALLGLGFEGGNLEHALDFAARFRAAGDPALAHSAELVAHEEVRHVRFALRWYERWCGTLDFAAWRGALPPPLTPLVLRGRPLARELRRRAGFDDAFLEALDLWPPCGS
jgi:uncharacterized ferritin-like protein (DUF455 family)